MSEDTGRIDLAHPKANLYGALPCPKCGGIYRIPFKQEETLAVGTDDAIRCEDCGFIEPITGRSE